MREKINRLARGIVEMDIPDLSLSPESFEGVVHSGELGRFELLLLSKNGIRMKGLIYSNNPKVTIRKNAFGGIRSKIICEVDAKDCLEKEDISGELLIVSNAGERSIPFRFFVGLPASAGIISGLHTAEDFVSLCVRDPDTALRIFDYDDFRTALFMQDDRLQAVYDGLKAGPDRKMELGEFLKSLSKGLGSGYNLAEQGYEALQGQEQNRNKRSVALAVKEKRGGAAAFLRDRINGFRKKDKDKDKDKEKDKNKDKDGSKDKDRYRDKDINKGGNGAKKTAGNIADNIERDRVVILTEKELQDPDKVEYAAAQYIRKEDTGSEAFRIYLKAILNGSKLTRLYEYCLYSLPEDYDSALPREVYLYFAHEKSLDDAIKLPLFYNILKQLDRESDIYRRFERKIQEYAIDELLKSRIDLRLALIYDRMIYPDMVDGRMAAVLPSILRTYKLEVEDERMVSVVVRYLSYNGEESYPIRNGVSYVPLLLGEYVLLFQDAYGNRYTRIAHEKRRILKKPLLERRCFDINPDQPMERLKRADQLARRGDVSRGELLFIEDVIENVDLTDQCRRFLLSSVLKYYDRDGALVVDSVSDDETRFLVSIQVEKLSVSERQSLIRAVLSIGEYRYAYLLIKRYGIEGIPVSALYRLLRFMINELSGESSPYLLMFSRLLFEEHLEDDTILYYMLEHYNGLSKNMLQILERAVNLSKKAGSDIAPAKFENQESEAGADNIVAVADDKVADIRAAAASAGEAGGKDGVAEGKDSKAGEKSAETEESEEIPVFSVISINKNREDGLEASAKDSSHKEWKKDREKDREGFLTIEALSGSHNIGTSATGREESADADNVYADRSTNDSSSGLATGIRTDAGTTTKAVGKGGSGRLNLNAAVIDMAERLLAQLIFTHTKEGLDEVMEIYEEGEGTERSLYLAYLTVRSSDYFLYGNKLKEEFFSMLYSFLRKENFKDKIPVIYMLALTKHMSEKETLSVEEKMELKEMVSVLLEQKMVFAYTRDLSKFIPLPDYVTDRQYIEYRGNGASKPTLYIRILPDEEEFHVAEMEKVYQNIFVCALSLFSAEKAEYRIYSTDMNNPEIEGEVYAAELRSGRGGAYDILNALSRLSISSEDNEKLLNAMLSYARQAALIDILFGSAAGAYAAMQKEEEDDRPLEQKIYKLNVLRGGV